MPNTREAKLRTSASRALPILISKSNPWDKAVERLSRKGFTAAVIATHTGLTQNQIARRRKAFEVSPLSWRQGKSREAQELIARIDKMLSAVKALARHKVFRAREIARNKQLRRKRAQRQRQAA